ncbi:MAG: VOC family protein [Betaproteobacteria bacterium]
MILKLHHAAYRCRNSEETRHFYEDFLGLPLVDTIHIEETKTARVTHVLHTFYRLDDGSHLAFFEVPDAAFDFKAQHDFDLHIALEVAADTLEPMRQKGRSWNIETRGVSDHRTIHSIYFRDPNGYVVELCVRQPSEISAAQAASDAKDALNRWTAEQMT